MAEIKFPIVELAADKFQVSVDTSLYAKEVITAAIYKFSHLFYNTNAQFGHIRNMIVQEAFKPVTK